MTKRHLEFRSGGSEKFWKIKLSGSSFTVTFGRLGTNGQAQTKDFDTPTKAKAAAEKLIAEKLGKGYVDAGGSAARSKGKPSAKSVKATKKPPAPKPSKSKTARKASSSLGQRRREQAMDKPQWKALLKILRVETLMGKITPAKESELKTFEKENGIALPASYRSFCSVFGAGELGKDFYISAPGVHDTLSIWSLQRLQEMSHDGVDYAEYSSDPKQHARSIFFACDILTWKYFFDPEDVTNAGDHEYAVHRLSRDWRVWRICDNFGQFVTEFCLGSRHNDLFEDEQPVQQLFRPVSK